MQKALAPALFFAKRMLPWECEISRIIFLNLLANLGISFDGKRVSFETTCPSSALSWGSWLGQIYQFGASIWRALKLPVGTTGKLHRLADLDSHPKFPFTTLETMIIALRLSSETEMSGEERNRQNGISEKYQNEVMTPETYRRLSQSVAEINDLSLSMALQDVDQGPSHSGGSTREILDDMMRRSGAHLRRDTRVLGLHYELISEGEKAWIVKSRKEDSEELEFSTFQKIILATPWDPTLVEIDEEFDFPLQEAEYRSRHLTLFTTRGGLSSSFFGYPNGAKVPEQMLPRITPNLSLEQLSGIHEIAFVREITRVIDNQAITESLFRILSTREVDNEVLRSLIDGDQDGVTWVHRAFIPHAYPLLYARTGFPLMRLSASFWHTGAVETFTSSIDGAMFAGANVAALAIGQLETERSKR
ncbi:hypothetical protein MMC22_007182 [Lobaria immixta]|nr:hypothetical protein [Lobaria immixta]